MSTILLPIKPQYVKEILEGRKRYEFRKNKPKRPVTRIVIYASWPQQLVVGEAIIDEILEGSSDEIWNITKEFARIPKQFFSSYYAGRSKAVAYRLSEIIVYNTTVTTRKKSTGMNTRVAIAATVNTPNTK